MEGDTEREWAMELNAGFNLVQKEFYFFKNLAMKLTTRILEYYS